MDVRNMVPLSVDVHHKKRSTSTQPGWNIDGSNVKKNSLNSLLIVQWMEYKVADLWEPEPV